MAGLIHRINVLLLALLSLTQGARYGCENFSDDDSYCIVSSVSAEPHSCRIDFPENSAIQLQFAHLETLSARLLYRMTHVERLDIVNSYIRSAFLKPELKYFRVSRCQLNELQIDKAEVYQLTELLLPENELASVPNGVNLLTNVTLIDLSNNHLSFLDMNEFTGLDKLTILGLSYNNIKVVFSTGPVELPSLMFLNFANNSINTLDISRWNISKLHELDVSSNKLERIDNNLLDQLPAIHNVNFAENPWNCPWRDDFRLNAEGKLDWTGLDMCEFTFNINGLAQKTRQEQSVKNSLTEIISNIASNLTETLIDVDSIVEDVFCRIIQGE
ncbi:phospholipase A2 inhibitor beta-like [Armigeres subalbatus]|uniref:phospholipase A2 inhibitor beta-like n=1 Tax=Armigeres subalbatus TaxID=124917 RepID=UPI002ED6729D